MDNMDKLKSLITQANAASVAYYNSGKNIMSDAEFDDLITEIERLEKELGCVLSNSPTVNVGSKPIGKFDKSKLEYPMLSLKKVHSFGEVAEFIDDKKYSAMVKLDGMSIRITYEDGKLVKAETRGDGEVGELVTEHVKNFVNVPLEIPFTDKFLIDGEAIITYEDFQAVNKANGNKFQNPRNLVAGTLGQLDPSECSKRRVRFIAWDVIQGLELYNSVTMKLLLVQDFFDIVPMLSYNNAESDVNDILEIAKNKSYPCDGVVFKYDDVAYGKTLGRTGHHFRNGIAYKPANKEYATILRDIEWSTTRTGVINPVAIFDNVKLDDEADTTRCTLHNVSYIEDLELGIGDEILVKRSNGVIPKIVGNNTRSKTYEFPKICPACDGIASIKNTETSRVLVCDNPECTAKIIDRLIHFCSKGCLDIKGMSDATIEFLYNRGWLNSFNDIFHLTEHKKEWMQYDGFGKRSVEVLLKAIEDARNTTLDRFIASLGIPLVGKNASQIIAKHCNYDINEFTYALDHEDYNWTLLPDFSTKTDKAIKKWYASINLVDWDFLVAEFNFQKPNYHQSDILKGKSFVVTGSVYKFKNRDELSAKIKSLGGKVSGSVSKTTSYLINNDVDSTSSKNKKAKELGVPIITEDEFMEMI